MSRSLVRRGPALAAVLACLTIAACGGSGNGESGTSGGGSPATTAGGGGNITEKLFAGTAADNRKNPDQGKKGGKLTVLSAGDVDYMDPGQTYYTYAIRIMNAMDRGLYAYLPGSTEQAVPDLADGDPQISNNGKTVTVKLKTGVKFSRPVSREVTSKDVKYAIERGFTANVANGYVGAYFGDLVGAPKAPGAYKPIPGIQTPDDQTIVFKLTKGTGAALAGALAMPISIPVPKEYALKYDKQ